MSRNDRRRHNHKNWNNSGNNNQNQNQNQKNQNNSQNNNNQNNSRTQEQSRQTVSQTREKFPRPEINESEQLAAIREFKARGTVCAKCGKPIEDMTSAMSDADGKAVHFDCVLESLKSKESMLPGQQMTYIGNGRFAVVTFENPRDLKKFKIEKIIEYEDKSKPIEWRNEMADLYSQVK
ncbi:MAG: hypothetical protein KBT21_00965 [Treponema sp.]|nr:hypothetical protein [Candidatus Treponema merdequi]